LLDLRELRVATSTMAKSYAVRAKAAQSAMEARDCMVEGVRELETLYNTSVSCLSDVWFDSDKHAYGDGIQVGSRDASLRIEP
jgi:hypothetical protein